MSGEVSQSGFRRGIMSLVVLALLKREDMYGYQLVQNIETLSGGKITTQEGSLYPVLYKLADQGLISDKKVQVGRRMTRVYYHLEPEGEKKLDELIREYRELSQGVFQIIEGSEERAKVSSHVEISVGGLQPASDERRTEEKNPDQSGDLRLGLCY